MLSKMSFYHIQIHHKENRDEFKINLTEEQLSAKVVGPYISGNPIVLNGRTIELNEIGRLRIFKTIDNLEKIVEEVREQQRTDPYKMFSPAPEWEAMQTGEDVTDNFIDAPAGNKKESNKSMGGVNSEVQNGKIFISHSSLDVAYVKSFVENILILGLDITAERVFCSSMEGHGIRRGQYIPDRLREEVKKASLALLFISKNYKSSEVCLNELGAAWATLSKETVVPLLLPDTDFNQIGFININRLGLKISERKGILKLIQDCKQQLNGTFNIDKLHSKIEDFIGDVEAFSSKKDIANGESGKVDDWIDCFETHLYPLNDIIRKAIPANKDGIHKITDTKVQIQILTDLSKANFLKDFWYKQAEGDFYVERIQKTPAGTWLISGFNWEIKVSDMWVCMDTELQYEFILIRSEKQPPYEINSDIGGTGYTVGLLRDGTIVSENERLNGYAIINGESIELSDVEIRVRDSESHWVFLVSDYHKAGFNADDTIEFCKKLDSGEIEVSEENIYNFLRSLRNNPTVIRFR